jgi:hypothetical protein
MRALPIVTWLAIGALVALPATPPAAQVPSALQPDLGEDEMRAIVAESLGVEILSVEVVEHDGEPAYAITVMSPQADRNDAFRVATLLFDGASGALLGQRSAAPHAEAPDLSTAPVPSGFESGGQEIRRRSLR